MSKNRFLFVLILFIFSSCKTYTIDDHIGIIDISESEIQSNKHSNYLIYENSVNEKIGEEIIVSPKFGVYLPKGLIETVFVDSRDFLFSFKNNQLVFIRILDKKKLINSDFSVSNLTKDEISSLSESYFFERNGVKIFSRRNNILLSNDYIKIYLLNTLNNNKSLFIDHLKSFKFHR